MFFHEYMLCSNLYACSQNQCTFIHDFYDVYVYANIFIYIFLRMARATNNRNASNVEENETPINMDSVTMITKMIREIVNACELCQCSTFDKFFRLQPPAFVGGSDPLVAEVWIAQMEKIFKYVPCTEEEKVDFATFMLKDDAINWWNFTCLSLKNKVGENNTIGWESFKTMFLNRYFPQGIGPVRGKEFIDLKQGTLTVAEYAREFERLSRFAPCVVDTEVNKACLFVRGLNPELFRRVGYRNIGTYSEVLRQAQLAEYIFHDEDANSESSEHSNGKRIYEYGNESGNCYGNRKRGRVYACYSCGEEGHKIKECPYKRQRS